MKTVEFYQGDPKVGGDDARSRSRPRPTANSSRMQLPSYQVADDLYMHRRYHIDAEPAAPAAKAE